MRGLVIFGRWGWYIQGGDAQIGRLYVTTETTECGAGSIQQRFYYGYTALQIYGVFFYSPIFFIFFEKIFFC
jgi:hypothetical protein